MGLDFFVSTKIATMASFENSTQEVPHEPTSYCNFID